MKQFFGLKELRSISPIERKSYLGNDVVEITYKIDGSKQEIPKAMFDLAVSSSPIDLTSLRNKICKPIVGKMLALLLDSEIKVVYVDYVQQLLTASINDSLDKAEEVIWGKEILEKTLRDVNQRLTNNGQTNTIIKPE